MTHRRYGYHKMLVTGHSKTVRWKYHRAKSDDHTVSEEPVHEREGQRKKKGHRGKEDVHMRYQGNYALKTSASGTLGCIENNLVLPSSGLQAEGNRELDDRGSKVASAYPK